MTRQHTWLQALFLLLPWTLFSNTTNNTRTTVSAFATTWLVPKAYHQQQQHHFTRPSSQVVGITHSISRHGHHHSPHLLHQPPPHPTPFDITFCSGNARKVREISMILEEQGLMHPTKPQESLIRLHVLNVDLPEYQHETTAKIARHKAHLGSQLAGGVPSLVEDTALHLHALGGMPGPYIKWYQGKVQSGWYKLLRDDTSATATCTLAFTPQADHEPILFTGHVHGKMIPPQPGHSGFGWDAEFVPEGYSQPFSQWTLAEKNQRSHRGQAVRQFCTWFRHHYGLGQQSSSSSLPSSSS
eukprot:Nitzschia sp. Nitz4//scaffold31_size150131//69518//70565//NITZ4_002829-RA/size150131-snap-gene-0.72-mRNA-1//1//CDS//3329547662//4176//frame0